MDSGAVSGVVGGEKNPAVCLFFSTALAISLVNLNYFRTCLHLVTTVERELKLNCSTR